MERQKLLGTRVRLLGTFYRLTTTTFQLATFEFTHDKRYLGLLFLGRHGKTFFLL